MEEIGKGLDEPLIALMHQIYGPLITSDHLWRELGYSSSVALRMALNRGTLPVTLMELPHRHGKFGLTIEIAKWLFSQRIKNCPIAFRPADAGCGERRSFRSVLLHEPDLMSLLLLETRSQLCDRQNQQQLPFPAFTIDQRQTKLFALACEVPRSLLEQIRD